MNLTWLLICFQKTRFKFKHSLFLSVRWLRLHPTHAKTFALRLHFLICEKWLSNLNVDLYVFSLAIWRLMAFFGNRRLKNLEARNDGWNLLKWKSRLSSKYVSNFPPFWFFRLIRIQSSMMSVIKKWIEKILIIF